MQKKFQVVCLRTKSILGILSAFFTLFIPALLIAEENLSPKLIYSEQPKFPIIEYFMGKSAEVKALLTVGFDGSVKMVEIVAGPQAFHYTAEECFMKWKYEPFDKKKTKSVSVMASVKYTPPAVPEGERIETEIDLPADYLINISIIATQLTKKHINIYTKEAKRIAFDLNYEGYAENIVCEGFKDKNREKITEEIKAAVFPTLPEDKRSGTRASYYAAKGDEENSPCSSGFNFSGGDEKVDYVLPELVSAEKEFTYTDDLRKIYFSMHIKLEFLIDIDGRVKFIRLLSLKDVGENNYASANCDFLNCRDWVASALILQLKDMLESRQYTPCLKNGKPVRVWQTDSQTITVKRQLSPLH